MAIFLVSTSFHSHAAVTKAGPEAIGLWVCAGSWCACHSPDGFVPRDMLPVIRGTSHQADALVRAGLWARAKGGWTMLRAVPCAPGARPVELWSIERTDYRRKIPASVRDHVFERDGHRCGECGATEDLTLDHIFPWTHGGKDIVSNLRVLCRPCNSSKGARIDDARRPGGST